MTMNLPISAHITQSAKPQADSATAANDSPGQPADFSHHLSQSRASHQSGKADADAGSQGAKQAANAPSSNSSSKPQDTSGTKTDQADDNDSDNGPGGQMGTAVEAHHVAARHGPSSEHPKTHRNGITPLISKASPAATGQGQMALLPGASETARTRNGQRPGLAVQLAHPPAAAKQASKGPAGTTAAHEAAQGKGLDAATKTQTGLLPGARLSASPPGAQEAASMGPVQKLNLLARQQPGHASNPDDALPRGSKALLARTLKLAGASGHNAAANSPALSGTQNPLTLQGLNLQAGPLGNAVPLSFGHGRFSAQFSLPDQQFDAAGHTRLDASSNGIGAQTGPNSVIPGGTAQPALGATATAGLGAPLGSEEWSQALGQQTLKLAADGTRHARIQLHPRELGQINISVTISHHNQAQVHFAAAHAHVREAIEAALPQLGQALTSGGLSLGEASVGDQNSQPGFADSGNGNPHHEGSERAAVPATEPAASPAMLSGQLPGGIDTFV